VAQDAMPARPGGAHQSAQIADGQRWHVRIFPPAGESLLPNQTCFFYSQLEFIDSEELLWGVEPEFFEAAWTVLPAGAENLTVGPVTYKLLSNLVAPKKPGEVEYSALVQTLADHFNPTPSEIVQRFKFNSWSRKPGESVAMFVAELRAIATTCNFGDTLEAMLRDGIVCGVNDNAIQKRLLAEPKLTFQQALDLARGLETVAQNVKELKTPQGCDVT